MYKSREKNPQQQQNRNARLNTGHIRAAERLNQTHFLQVEKAARRQKAVPVTSVCSLEGEEMSAASLHSKARAFIAEAVHPADDGASIVSPSHRRCVKKKKNS